MLTCLGDFEEEIGLFFEDDFCLNKHVEGSNILEGEVFLEERNIFEDGCDVLQRVFEAETVGIVPPGSDLCCPQPLFRETSCLDVCSCDFSDMSVAGVSSFGFEEGEERWTTWDALPSQVAAQVRSGADQVVPGQVEALPCASAAELGVAGEQGWTD